MLPNTRQWPGGLPDTGGGEALLSGPVSPAGGTEEPQELRAHFITSLPLLSCSAEVLLIKLP